MPTTFNSIQLSLIQYSFINPRRQLDLGVKHKQTNNRLHRHRISRGGSRLGAGRASLKKKMLK